MPVVCFGATRELIHKVTLFTVSYHGHKFPTTNRVFQSRLLLQFPVWIQEGAARPRKPLQFFVQHIVHPVKDRPVAGRTIWFLIHSQSHNVIKVPCMFRLLLCQGTPKRRRMVLVRTAAPLVNTFSPTIHLPAEEGTCLTPLNCADFLLGIQSCVDAATLLALEPNFRERFTFNATFEANGWF